MSLDLLREWSDVAGEVYGSEDQAQLFYAVIKMQKPSVIVELGTALGVTSFWMAQAVKENGAGRVFTVDNGLLWQLAEALFERAGKPGEASPGPRQIPPEALAVFAPLLRRLVAARPVFHGAVLRDARLLATPHKIRAADLWSYGEFLDRMAEILGLGQHVSFLRGTLATEDAIPVTAERCPFLAPALEAPIDLLFSDCGHNVPQVLGVLAQFLPRLSPDASIFIDSAATYLPSYLALEETVRQLNAGKVPAVLLAGADERDRARLLEIAATRQIRMMPIVERKDRAQNGLVWLKMSPANVVPYPVTMMRGMYEPHGAGHALSRETLATYLRTGRWEGPRSTVYDAIT